MVSINKILLTKSNSRRTRGVRIIKIRFLKNMASQDYLIAIALIEQNKIRAMPLGGKEIKDNLDEEGNLKKLGEEVILNLLLRVFQRSDEGALKRVSEDKGLLLVHMHPKRMQKELPFIKSEWIRDGDTNQFLKYLGNLSKEIWTASFVKYKGVDLISIAKNEDI